MKKPTFFRGPKSVVLLVVKEATTNQTGNSRFQECSIPYNFRFATVSALQVLAFINIHNKNNKKVFTLLIYRNETETLISNRLAENIRGPCTLNFI